MNSTTLESTSAETRAQTLSAVGDPIRLQILDMLTLGQRCACDIQDEVGVAANLLSYHLRVLREAGLVEATRRGRWIDYRLAPDAITIVSTALPEGIGGTA
jgi:ArsR family transcriptional regulator